MFSFGSNGLSGSIWIPFRTEQFFGNRACNAAKSNKSTGGQLLNKVENSPADTDTHAHYRRLPPYGVAGVGGVGVAAVLPSCLAALPALLLSAVRFILPTHSDFP